jgi:AcrR family transcriptional regulator
VTHAAVAQRAGVGRATVYRHWPKQQHLLLDTLAESAEPLLSVGEGAVPEQLVKQLVARLDWLNRPRSASVIAALIDQAERDPLTGQMRQRMYETAVEELRAALRIGVERGELRLGADDHAALLLTRIMGPLFFQRFLLGQAVDEEFAARSVDNALSGWRPYR